MTIRKLLIGGTSLLVAGLLIAGIFFPDSFLMNFADSGQGYAFTRAFLLSMLISLLLSRPPRSATYRITLGVLAGFFTLMSLGFLYTFQMSLLDALVFIEVSIVFAVEALELSRRSLQKGREAARSHRTRTRSGGGRRPQIAS